MKRLPARLIDTTGASNGDGLFFDAATSQYKPQPGGGSVAGLPVFDVVAYGALIDGITDDTPAWQACINACAAAGGGRIISSKMGVSLIGGALQDTSGGNAQLLLPAVDAVDSENITIVIEGGYPPPNVVSVIGATPVPDNHLVLKSTLTAGSGGALLGGVGPAGTYQQFTNVTVQLLNVAFRMPSNPTHTAVDLRHAACAELDNVIADTGSYYVQGLAQPTTSTSFGIRLPAINNGAHVRLGQVDVIGFYNGIECNEHTSGQYVAAWGCYRAAVFTAANHASKFQRLAAYHCTKGVVFTGTHYVDVDQFDVEHATSGWWATSADIDDASNYGHGSLVWHVVKAGVGIDATFTLNGASNLVVSRVGTAPGGGVTTLDGLSDVTITGTPADGQVLRYDATSSQWIPGTSAAAAGAVVPVTTLDSSGNLVFVTADDGSLVTVEV